MHLLRKIAAIVLITGIVAPSGVFHFVSDIPEILAHYEHHNRQHESVSFGDFLVEHVLEAHHPDAEHPEHSGFPEHHHHTSACCATVFVAYIPPSPPVYELSFPDYRTDEAVKISRSRQFNPSEYASAIWQPPQVS